MDFDEKLVVLAFSVGLIRMAQGFFKYSFPLMLGLILVFLDIQRRKRL